MALQNHAHIGLTVNGLGEPTYKIFTANVSEDFESHAQLERSLDGTARIHALVNSSTGAPLIYPVWKVKVLLRKDRIEGEPDAYARFHELAQMQKQVGYFISNHHVGDGLDHTADQHQVYIEAVQDIQYETTTKTVASCTILLRGINPTATSNTVSALHTLQGIGTVVRLGELSDVDLSSVSDGYVLTYDQASDQWEAQAASGGGGASTLAGLSDVLLTSPNSTNKIFFHNGTQWVNGTPADAGLASASHVNDTANPHSVTPAQVGNNTAQWNADTIQDLPVSSSAPNDGDGLVYNSTSGEIEWAAGGAGGVSTFVALSDTPADISSSNEYLLRVNTAGDAIEAVNKLAAIALEYEGTFGEDPTGAPPLAMNHASNLQHPLGGYTIDFERSRGTLASPAAVNTTETLGRLRFNGFYDGTSQQEIMASIVGEGTSVSGSSFVGRLTLTAFGQAGEISKIEMDNDIQVTGNAVFNGTLSASGGFGAFGKTPLVTRPTVTGSTDTAKITSIIAQLVNLGLVTDGTT